MQSIPLFWRLLSVLSLACPARAPEIRQSDMSQIHRAPVNTCKRTTSMSLDFSGAELSGSFCSSGTADISCPGDATPRLIPTPSIPSFTSAEDYPGGARSGMSSLFTTQEISQIMKAQQLVGQLRHRFDCQPERYVGYHSVCP